MKGKIRGGPDFDRFRAEVQELVDGDFKNVVRDLGKVPWINSRGPGIFA